MISILTFSIAHLAGDPAVAVAGKEATAAEGPIPTIALVLPVNPYPPCTLALEQPVSSLACAWDTMSRTNGAAKTNTRVGDAMIRFMAMLGCFHQQGRIRFFREMSIDAFFIVWKQFLRLHWSPRCKLRQMRLPMG